MNYKLKKELEKLIFYDKTRKFCELLCINSAYSKFNLFNHFTDEIRTIFMKLFNTNDTTIDETIVNLMYIVSEKDIYFLMSVYDELKIT